MTAVTRASVKTMFQSGDRPSEQDFIDFIDSCAFLVDNNDVTVSGSSMNLTGNLTIAGTTSASSAWFGGRVRTFADLHVSGSVFVSGNVSVSGGGTFQGSLTTLGNVSVSGDVSADEVHGKKLQFVSVIAMTAQSTSVYTIGPFSDIWRQMRVDVVGVLQSGATDSSYDLQIGTSAGFLATGYSIISRQAAVEISSYSTRIPLIQQCSAVTFGAQAVFTLMTTSSRIYSVHARSLAVITSKGEGDAIGTVDTVSAGIDRVRFRITPTNLDILSGRFLVTLLE